MLSPEHSKGLINVPLLFQSFKTYPMREDLLCFCKICALTSTNSYAQSVCNKCLLSKWLNIKMLILALLFTPTWFFSLVPELCGHSWLVSAQEHVRDPWVHLHTASNCTSYNTRQIRMGMHICDSQLTPRASSGVDAARRNSYISGPHWAEAKLSLRLLHFILPLCMRMEWGDKVIGVVRFWNE